MVTSTVTAELHSIDPRSLASAGAAVVGASAVGIDVGTAVVGVDVGPEVVGLRVGPEVGASLGAAVGAAVARQPWEESLVQIS